MPSIAAFIHGLLSEDMYATGMLEKMDDRIPQLNAGQLRLLRRYVEQKVPGLTNKTVLDSYTKLLRKATAEADKRYEEEVRGERERLKKLKVAHAGVNAKAWDTSHANLDRELAKFQKFLKQKARRVAEEEIMQEEMEKLRDQVLSLPARRVAADNKKHAWWAFGGFLVVVVGPILVLSLLPMGVLINVLAFLGLCAVAAVCWFVGMLRGIVVVPSLDDDDIEKKTRKRAHQTLKKYRADVRRTFEATESIFAADMKWRDDWVRRRRQERRNERKKAKAAMEEDEAARRRRQREGSDGFPNSGGGKIFPEEEGCPSGNSDHVEEGVPKDEDDCSSGRVPLAAKDGASRGGGMARPGTEMMPPSTSSGAGGPPVAEECRDSNVNEEMGGGKEGLPTAVNRAKDSGKHALERDQFVFAEEPAHAGPVLGRPGEAACKPEDNRENMEGTSRTKDADSSGLLDRTRGPCQGCGLPEKPGQGLEERDHQSLPEAPDGRESPPPLAGATSTTAQTRDIAAGSQQAESCGGVLEGKGDMGV